MELPKSPHFPILGWGPWEMVCSLAQGTFKRVGTKQPLSENTGTVHLIALCFSALRRHSIFYRLKICGNPALSKSISAICPAAFAYFTALSHFSNSTMFQTVSLLLYLLQWSVIFDVKIVIVQGHRKLYPYKANWIDKCCVCSDCSTNLQFPCFSPTPWASLFLETEWYRD